MGKTTLALKHRDYLIAKRRVPSITLACVKGVKQFRSEFFEYQLRDVIDSVWKHGDHVYYAPKSLREVDELCAAIMDAQDVVLMVDEAHVYLNAKGECSDGLISIMRAHAHCGLHVLLTTQHFSGDIPQPARSCAPYVHVFQSSGKASRDLLVKGYQVPENVLLGMDVGEYVTIDPSNKLTLPDRFSGQASVPQIAELPPSHSSPGE